MIILGIETSCDDTGVGIIDCGKKNCRILANVVSSQIKIHAPFGGVVPNLAARAHLKNIKPCLKQALKEAGNPKIDLIAVTAEPGLIPCLLVGENFAKALAYNWQIPLVKINHLEAHIFANWLSAKLSAKVRPSQLLRRSNLRLLFPLLALIVSGGHTQLVLMDKNKKFRLIGQTRDDAAGEAFDKVAKLLGLGYPGGPIISQRAEKGNPEAFALPRPMINSPDFDFSFSGLKTAVLYKVKDSPFCLRFLLCHSRESGNPEILSLRSRMTILDSRVKPENDTFQKAENDTLRSQKFINDMAASFQQAAIDVLISKTIKAAKKYKVKTIVLAGGVAANKNLREQTKEKIKDELTEVGFQIPDIKLCADNGVMIAAAAWYGKNIKRKLG